jgi:caffeoyl-CoA O-methyltransferase
MPRTDSNTMPLRHQHTDYLQELFGHPDRHLGGLMGHAVEQGLPDIAVPPEVGRVLTLLVSMTRGELAIEVGTLGGYSGISLARGLSSNGRLITIEPNQLHADFAQDQFITAGVGTRVVIRRGTGLEILPTLREELGTDSVDVIFLDALKTEYPAYWEIVRPMIRIGGLILADNVLGSGDWEIDDVGHPSRDAADRFNRLVADDRDFQSIIVPIGHGILIGRRIK